MYMGIKKCCYCNNEKETSEFGKDKNSKDGLSYRCKKCNNEIARKRKKKKIIFKCNSCGKEKVVNYQDSKKRKTQYCSNCFSKETQKGIKRPQFSNENSGRWGGGEYISSDGYKMIKCEGSYHPSGRQLYKKEHIIVYEEHLGRKIKTQKGYMGEQVHHIDGNKLNNNIDNLILCNDTREHKTIHCQLEKISYYLVEIGVIKFNKDSKKYYIDESRIN